MTEHAVPTSVKAVAACLAAYAIAFLALGIAVGMANEWASVAGVVRGAIFMVGPAIGIALLLRRLTRWVYWAGLSVAFILFAVNALIAFYQVVVFQMAHRRGPDLPGALGIVGIVVILLEVALLAGAVVILLLPTTRAAFSSRA